MEPHLNYSIDTTLFPIELRAAVTEFVPDDELTAFLKECRLHPHTFWDFLRLDFLSMVMTDYEAHGVLGIYPMHLLSTPQWNELIPEPLRQGLLLDIGAGQGFVTQRAHDLFSRIYATETSSSMAQRLQKMGYVTETADIAIHPALYKDKEFDVISLLNVLDRCDQQITLLQNAVQFLKDDGVMILTDPLPLQQTTRTPFSNPKERLARLESDVWEENFIHVYETVLKPAHLLPIRISRLPYVYKFTRTQPYVVLDDFLVVCKKT